MIEFDEPSHTYTIDGKVIPSVTQILAPLTDLSKIPWAVLEAKRRLGTDVHKAAELYDNGRLDESSVSDRARPYLEAYKSFLSATGAVVLLNEHRVYHPIRHYAGTLDRLYDIDGVEWLVDIKTSSQIYRATGPQLFAYMMAGELKSGTRRAALQLKPDGSYRLHEFSNHEDWDIFIACQRIHKYKEQQHV